MYGVDEQHPEEGRDEDAEPVREQVVFAMVDSNKPQSWRAFQTIEGERADDREQQR